MVNIDYNKLGEILQDARNKARLKQSEIALMVNCTPSNISSWERGKSKVDIDSFAKLCEIYDIDFASTLNDVINNSDNKEINSTLKEKEKSMIKKYRTLDDYGQEAVDKILEIEHKRCVDINNKVINYNNQINTVTTAEIARTYDNRESFSSYETPVEDLEIFDIAKQSQDKL